MEHSNTQKWLILYASSFSKFVPNHRKQSLCIWSFRYCFLNFLWILLEEFTKYACKRVEYWKIPKINVEAIQQKEVKLFQFTKNEYIDRKKIKKKKKNWKIKKKKKMKAIQQEVVGEF